MVVLAGFMPSCLGLLSQGRKLEVGKVRDLSTGSGSRIRRKKEQVLKVVYLHGFRSSPLSAKAQMLRQHFEARRQGAMKHHAQFYSPQLPASPKEAVAFVVNEYAPGPQDCLIGSSLGGYYAAYLAENFGSRCVLLNPATDPGRDLAPYVGEHKMFHSDQAFVFKAAYLSQGLKISAVTKPERYFLIAAKGDELLDYREMLTQYPAGRIKLLEQSDHGLSDFVKHLDEVVQFCL
jgi:uncharacterized protein